LTRGAADEKRTDTTEWACIEALTGEQALHNALADEDNPPLTDEQLARMRRVPNPQESAGDWD
jgi:putative transcriptional regulator